MSWSTEALDQIFQKTNGRCHLCAGSISRNRYGDVAAKHGWEVEHSVAKANGGTDHLNNLYPAHPRCNRSKGTESSAAHRATNGLSRPPMSAEQISDAKTANARGGAAAGAIVGLLVRAVFAPAGPAGLVVGSLVGAIVGGLIGDSIDPEE